MKLKTPKLKTLKGTPKKVRVLEIIASLSAIVGVFFTATGNPGVGFWFSLVASVNYALYGYLTGQLFLLLSSFVYFV